MKERGGMMRRGKERKNVTNALTKGFNPHMNGKGEVYSKSKGGGGTHCANGRRSAYS